MSRRLTHWLVLGVVTTLVGLMGAQPAQAADKPKPVPGRASFGLQPATKGKIDSRPAYRYGVTPGGTLKDQVAIRNISLQALTFRVYATDALNNPDGGFGLMPAAQRPRDAGSWLSVGGAGFSGAVRVGARATVVLPLALTVPQNAQPGDHTGGVIVSLATRSTNKQGAAVILDQRVATRVYIRVSGPLKPQLTIKPVRASYAGSINPFGRGKTVARYTVTNTGNVNIGADQVVKVRGLLGPTSLARPKPANLDLLFPGSSVQVAVTVPRTWPLIRERLTVSLSPLVQVADPVAGLGTFTATTSFWEVPWAPLALIVILGLLGWLIRRMRRSRRPQAPAAGQATMLGERRARRLGALSSMAVAATSSTEAATWVRLGATSRATHASSQKTVPCRT